MPHVNEFDRTRPHVLAKGSLGDVQSSRRLSDGEPYGIRRRYRPLWPLPPTEQLLRMLDLKVLVPSVRRLFPGVLRVPVVVAHVRDLSACRVSWRFSCSTSWRRRSFSD